MTPESSRGGHEPILQLICQGLMPGATEERDKMKETIVDLLVEKSLGCPQLLLVRSLPRD